MDAIRFNPTSNEPLQDLAAAAGLQRHWQGADGKANVVSDEALRAILERLGYPASNPVDIRESRAAVEAELQSVPRLLTADVGKPIGLAHDLKRAVHAEIVPETGGPARQVVPVDGRLPPVEKAGYYRVRILGRQVRLAVAPPTCFYPGGPEGRKRCWGPAIQIPSLRTGRPAPFGDLEALSEAVALFAQRGADAVAISPVHAISAHAGAGFSPYSPSSRLFFNTALAAPRLAGLPGFEEEGGGAIIDWESALSNRSKALRCLFAALEPSTRARIDAWVGTQGEALQRHALFEALSLHFGPRHAGGGAPDWRDWPAEYRDTSSPAVARFREDHAQEIAFHLFAQWLAGLSLAHSQDRARGAGMAIGLIADLAVGIDPGGSDAWAMQQDVFSGLTIGAPPDPLGPEGQNWGLTAFSPRGLARSGFEPWLATIRSALRHAGGLRIDHAFGLSRLWIIPAGADAAQGAYLSFPFRDMVRLIALESHLAKAVIIAEDLGTRPPGFDEVLAGRDLLGMRVLWFERSAKGSYRAPATFEAASVAMTSTHDTPTVAGWWSGRDLAWNSRLGRGGDPQIEQDKRSEERQALWQAIGGTPPSTETSSTEPEAIVDAAVSHVAGARSDLAIVALEDLLGLEEQPNIPGTVGTHPNWCRRMAAATEELLQDRRVQGRIDTLNRRAP
ncbi:4-alpha-glucanotransferase [Novosphingobium sp. ZW T3_23]|uniref:4-alpha-glucanotransferase n=1 Tax=Novosphingobium sp. ZW T3_23 TaxID=3378084 RepID=UPI003854B465